MISGIAVVLHAGGALIVLAFNPAVLMPSNKLHNCGAVAHLHEQMQHTSNGINAPSSKFPDLK